MNGNNLIVALDDTLVIKKEVSNSYSVIGYKFKNYKELTPIKSTFPPEKLHNIFCNTSTYKLHFTYKLLKTIFKILIQY